MTGSDSQVQLAPWIARYVKTLFREGRFGMCSGVARIMNITSGCASVEQKGSCGDRFRLVMPYAGQSISWEVLFNSQYPEDPPDFIFSPEDRDFVPDIDRLPSLLNWNPHDPSALLRVVQELLNEYRQYQSQLVEAHSRLKWEYDSLIESGNFSPKHIEVHVFRKSDTKVGPVNFLIRLPVDFSNIPPYLTKDKPGEDSAVLLVMFQTPECGKASPQLFLSPRVEQALGGSSCLRISAFPSGACLIDYVPTVTELLENKVQQLIQSFNSRRQYISAFVNEFGRSLIEFDSEGFRKIAFLMEWHDFYFVFTIDMPALFPKEQPVFTFQSGYHERCDGSPYCKVDKDYPYSPRWGPEEMVSRARTHILEQINDFQRESVTEGQLGQ